MEPFKTLKTEGLFELEEKKSIFVGRACSVDGEDGAKGFIRGVRADNADARHNCYAYIIGSNPGIIRASDDGEPQGTAGQPLLSALKSEGVINAVVVVTRFFGGVLLGAAGLTRAYGKAAREAVKAAGVVELSPYSEFAVTVDYACADRVRREVEAAGFAVIGAEYAAAVAFVMLAERYKADELKRIVSDASGGRARVDFVKTVML